MIKYDDYGRMKYNADFHERHGAQWSKEDLVYLCSMHGATKRKDLALALGRTESAVAMQLYIMTKKRVDLYNYYKNIGNE